MKKLLAIFAVVFWSVLLAGCGTEVVDNTVEEVAVAGSGKTILEVVDNEAQNPAEGEAGIEVVEAGPAEGEAGVAVVDGESAPEENTEDAAVEEAAEGEAGVAVVDGEDAPEENTEEAASGDVATGVAADSVVEGDVEIAADVAVEEVAAVPWAFVAYSEEVVSSALAEGKTVVLDFTAERCPTCVSFKENVEANMANLPENSVLVAVDFDAAEELKTTYEVTAQHTFVQLAADMSIEKKTQGGINTVEDLSAWIAG